MAKTVLPTVCPVLHCIRIAHGIFISCTPIYVYILACLMYPSSVDSAIGSAQIAGPDIDGLDNGQWPTDFAGCKWSSVGL